MPHNKDREPFVIDGHEGVDSVNLKRLKSAMNNKLKQIEQRKLQLKEAQKILEEAQKNVSRLEYDIKYLEGE